MVNYKIRRAVEEDNDDLVPLIDLYSKRLVELYGNYYIAEILTRHKDSGKVLQLFNIHYSIYRSTYHPSKIIKNFNLIYLLLNDKKCSQYYDTNILNIMI